MLSILSTNLCHQPTNKNNSPAILYRKLLHKRPCVPMAQRPDCRETGLDEGDIKPREKSFIDHAVETISTKHSKDLICDNNLLPFQSEKIPNVIGQAKMYIIIVKADCQKCKEVSALHFPKPECILAETAGTLTGWVAGISVVKVGKVAAFGLGGSIILLHFASECGYISVNWERVREACTQSQHWLDVIIRFLKKNSCYSVGFVGGFFFGVAST